MPAPKVFLTSADILAAAKDAKDKEEIVNRIKAMLGEEG